MIRHVLGLLAASAVVAPVCVGAEALEGLRATKFIAIFSVAGQSPFQSTNSIGQFTIKGPIRDTLKPLPRGMVGAAYDPYRKTYYAISNHSVFEVDLAEGDTREMKPEFKGDREFSWACGITFDSERRRLIVVSLGGVGYFYAYSPAERKWSVLADADNIDYSAIGYSPANDRVFAVYQGHSDQAGPTLCQINAAGALVKSTKLKHRPLAAAMGHGPMESMTQVIPLKEHVVVIVSPGSHGAQGKDAKTRMYVVNLKDDSVVETWSE